MRELLDFAASERLSLPEYDADFGRRFWELHNQAMWKVERQQFFQEPGYDPWEAFAKGSWQESLRLLEAGRARMVAEHRRMAERGIEIHRVRVVEEPLTAYLQWELHVLRVREQCGTGVRVVSAQQIASLEARAPLPEIVTLGSSVMYEPVYNEREIAQAGLRYTNPELVMRARETIVHLYGAGEPLADYFARAIVSLPQPTGQRTM